jgi:5-hydroxyisourate hydrolase
VSPAITTHVLDVSIGRPARNVRVEIFRVGEDATSLIGECVTNEDGRCAGGPILSGPNVATGVYELRFHIGDYLALQGVECREPRFLDVIPIRFGLSDVSRHYHVPLLVSPYGYATYLGS